MSRVACRIVAGLFALWLPAEALAADPAAGPAYVERCRAPEVVTARYEEQVCRVGAGGYSTCRWVTREHDVRVPAACEPPVTMEDARSANRGAFPPYARTPPRG